MQALRPLGAPQDVVGVGQSRALSPHSVSAGAFLHFALEPLVLVAHGSDVKALSVVGSRLQLDLLASVGVTEGMEVGLSAPLVLAQGSDNLEALGTEGAVRSFAMGDVRLRGKVAVPGLRRRAEDRGGVLRSPWGWACPRARRRPSPEREPSRGRRARWWITASTRGAAALDAGLWLRPTHEFLGVRWGNSATLGMGAEVPLLRGLGVTAVGTLTGSTPLAGQSEGARQVPVEGLVGLRWYSPTGLTFTVGAGGGCGCSLTAPTLRLVSSVVWVPYRGTEWHALERYKQPPQQRPAAPPPAAPVDADGDAVIGAADRCPGEAGPVENGGCPDADEDGDGVVDRRDACPRHAAGPRGREGCPWVRLEDGLLVPLEPVRFATGQEVPRPEALPLLEEVAALLLAHPEVQRVRGGGQRGHGHERGAGPGAAPSRPRAAPPAGQRGGRGAVVRGGPERRGRRDGPASRLHRGASGAGPTAALSRRGEHQPRTSGRGAGGDERGTRRGVEGGARVEAVGGMAGAGPAGGGRAGAAAGRTANTRARARRRARWRRRTSATCWSGPCTATPGGSGARWC